MRGVVVFRNDLDSGEEPVRNDVTGSAGFVGDLLCKEHLEPVQILRVGAKVDVSIRYDISSLAATPQHPFPEHSLDQLPVLW